MSQECNKQNQMLEVMMNELETDKLRINLPEQIIIHSTYSYPEVPQLLEKHKNINGWAGVGYHIFVSESRKINWTRPLSLEGAHTIGFNQNSIGVCFYSEDSKIEGKTLETGIGLIEYLRSYLGDIPVIAHAQAQVIYINSLLEEHGINKQFRTDSDIVKREVFKGLKEEVDEFMLQLSSSEHLNLKNRIKKLTNCPGELYLPFAQVYSRVNERHKPRTGNTLLKAITYD